MSSRTQDSSLLLVSTLLLGFLFLDEEPLLDWTDWNVLHIVLLTVSLLTVFAELGGRAWAGSLAPKDNNCMGAALVYWATVENYVQLLLIVFSVHSLAPMEADLLETTEAHSLYGGWLQALTLPGLLLNVLCLFLSKHYSQTLAIRSWWACTLSALSITALLTSSAVLLCWDLIISGLSAHQSWLDTAPLYQQAKTTLTYDQLTSGDAFDWHREQTRPFVARFEDLFLFLLELRLLWVSLVALFCWLLVLGKSEQVAPMGRLAGFTEYSVADWSLNNLSFCYLSLWCSYLLLSLRVLAKGLRDLQAFSLV